ncbi:MAG TPA: response regulator transcription factor [Thermoanaerobaculia bacterium]|jgi:DNA-binding response OmpR family regulator
MTKRVLIVEDNADLAYGLRNNLEIEGYAVDVAADGAAGLSRAMQTRPDLIVLDLMLPELDGFRVLRELRASHLTMPVLILTARGEESDKVRGLKLGADDYVTKPFGLLELLARIEALFRRNAPPPSRDVVRFGAIEIDRGARAVSRHGIAVELAPKEYELLVALYDRDGAAVPRLALMRQVWGYSDAVITRTIDTHIAELRRKLEDDPARPRHILTVRKIGYRLKR